MQLDFKHKPSGHCENGVVSNLLGFYGINISEAMVFGLGSGLFFAHMPFIKLHGMAVTSFRPLPGAIFSRVMSLLGIKMKRYKFRDKEKSMIALDKILLSGTPVGMLVGVYNLPYFPKEYRFHFNAHNICVIGKEGDVYTVSDPVVVDKCTLTYDELKTVRFAKGTYPPSGRMYHITDISHKREIDRETIRKSILLNCNRMTKIPIPMFGVNGIRFLARRMRRWERGMGKKRAALNLAQVIRMNEEIGTGGAGFRFIYAAFLQEAANTMNMPELRRFSEEMTSAGDMWRDFSYNAARMFKKRDGDTITYDILAAKLMKIADKEELIFKGLEKLMRDAG
ncbi:MAG: BtrH N-terminal domain-containing protein [Bacteroidales bacterium]|nr:BtrH N-terminal domain-containing protein [Bacteroidales bacterium]